jgi:hypothetical protein
MAQLIHGSADDDLGSRDSITIQGADDGSPLAEPLILMQVSAAVMRALPADSFLFSP